MGFWTYCCTKNSYTSYPIDVGCGTSSDINFYHLKGRVLPVVCEKNDWKSVGQSYAIDSDGTLWSFVGSGLAGVNAYNKGLPCKDNYCQVSDDTDWEEVVHGPSLVDTIGIPPVNELFLKNNGELYTLNNRIGLDIQNGGLSNNPITVPVPYKEFSFYPYAYNINNNTFFPGRSGLSIDITSIEAYDIVFPDREGLCFNKIKYSSQSHLEKGDKIAIVWDVPADSEGRAIPGCGYPLSQFPSGVLCSSVGIGRVSFCVVHHKISNSEFLTTDLVTRSKIDDLDKIKECYPIIWNFEDKVSDFLKSYSTANFASYTIDAPVVRARLKSKIKSYHLRPPLPTIPNDSSKKNILDSLQFSRKPTLHIKYYRCNSGPYNEPNPYNISNNDLDSDGFYHQCASYIRDNNKHYYNSGSMEQVEAIWKGKIDWIKILYGGSGYKVPPTVDFIPTDTEILDPNSLPQATAILDDYGAITRIEMTSNPFIWNKPPTIAFTVASGETGAGASGVCEIIGPIQNINIVSSGNGYTHEGSEFSKLVLVAQANIDDMYIHGIPSFSLTPTPSVTQTCSNTPTSSITPTRTKTPTITPTSTPTNSITPTATTTYSPTPAVTNSPTFSPTPEPSLTPSPSVTVSFSATPAITNSPTNTPPVSPTASVSSGPRIGSTPAINITPTATQTPPPSASKLVNITLTPSTTPTNTITRTPSKTPSATVTSTLSPTPYSPTPTKTQTPSPTFTPTITPTFTPTMTMTQTPSFTPSVTSSLTPTVSITPSATSRVRKIKLKQWIIADIELAESQIDYIEFTRPLFSFDSLLNTRDANGEELLRSEIDLAAYPYMPSTGIYVKTWGTSRDTTELVLAGPPIIVYSGDMSSGTPYTNIDLSSTFNANIYDNNLNYLTPEKNIQLELNDPTKEFLKRCFDHPHFKEAFIYGPGKRREGITSGNIDNKFDYKNIHMTYQDNTAIKNLSLYVCMEEASDINTAIDGKELYVRFGDPYEPNWAITIFEPITLGENVEDENGNITGFLFKGWLYYVAVAVGGPYITEAGPMTPKLTDVIGQGAEKRKLEYFVQLPQGGGAFVDHYIPGFTPRNPNVVSFVKEANQFFPAGGPIDALREVFFNGINFSASLTIKGVGGGPDREVSRNMLPSNIPGAINFYRTMVTLSKSYINPGALSLGCDGDQPGQFALRDACCTPMIRTFRNIQEIPENILNSTEEEVTYDGWIYNRMELINAWSGAIETARTWNTYDENQSDHLFNKGRKFSDAVAVSGDYTIADLAQITIDGENSNRTYINGMVEADNMQEMEFVDIPTNLPALYDALGPLHPGEDTVANMFDVTRIYITPRGLTYKIYTEFGYDEDGNIISVKVINPQPIIDYIEKIKPKDASTSISGFYDQAKYYYKLDNFMITTHTDKKIQINEQLPNSKAETAKIYFPANSFGSGAIFRLYPTIGPSGYIICDTATEISNNFYNTEPKGLIKTVGYDMPTRIGFSEHNFIEQDLTFKTAKCDLDGGFYTTSAPYRCLGGDHLYMATSNALYKEGGGLKFTFKTTQMPKDIIDARGFNYVISPPDLLIKNRASLDIELLTTINNLPTDVLNGAFLSLNPLPGDWINRTNYQTNTTTGNGYYFDGEILNLGQIININYPYENANLPIHPYPIKKIPFSVDDIESVDIAANFEPVTFNLSTSVIPYKINKLYSASIAEDQNGGLVMMPSLYGMINPIFNNAFIDPQDVRLFRVCVDKFLFADRPNDLGLNSKNFLTFKPRMSIAGGQGEDAKFDIGLTEREALIFNSNNTAKYWTMDEINILDGGRGYQINDNLSIVDNDQDSVRTLEGLPGPLIKVSAIGTSGNITALSFPNGLGNAFLSYDPFFGYCKYFPVIKGGLKDGKINGLLPEPAEKKLFSPEVRFQILKSYPYFYILNECDKVQDLTSLVENGIQNETQIIPKKYGSTIPIKISSAGSAVVLPSGILRAWSVGRPESEKSLFHYIDGYLTDSQYDTEPAESTITYSCGCIIPSLPEANKIYFDNYKIETNFDAIRNINLNTKFRYHRLMQVSDIDSQIEFKNYYSIDTDSLPSIKSSSDRLYSSVFVVDYMNQLKILQLVDAQDYEELLWPSIYLEGRVFAIIKCILCNHPLLNRKVKHIHGYTILDEQGQAFRIQS